MVYMQVLTEGEWQGGVSLEYETDPVAINTIWFSHCGDYNSRVVGFFTGVDAWGKTHRMAKIEQFLAINTEEYMRSHGLEKDTTHA